MLICIDLSNLCELSEGGREVKGSENAKMVSRNLFTSGFSRPKLKLSDGFPISDGGTGAFAGRGSIIAGFGWWQWARGGVGPSHLM